MYKLKICVLNVGHGDCIYVETPLGNNLVIDCGCGDTVPSEFLSSIGVRKIDELQISHPHTDHFDDIVNISRKNIGSLRCPSLDNFHDNVIGWSNQDHQKITTL
jgi:competence protein ComEC